MSIEKKKECSDLLTGGYDVFEIKDMEEFTENIKIIQDVYCEIFSKDAQGGKGSNINIQDEWRGYVG